MVALCEVPLASVTLVEGPRPERVRDGAGDPFHEGLAEEGWAGPAPADRRPRSTGHQADALGARPDPSAS